MSFLDKSFVRSQESIKAIYENTPRRKKTAVFGMSEFHKAFAVHGFNEFVLYVAADYVEAMEMLNVINSYGNNFVYLPPRDEVLFYRRTNQGAFGGQRSEALNRMIKAEEGVVTTIEALLQKYPCAESFKRNTIQLKKGESADIFSLVSRLVQMGYSRDEDLSHAGTFTRRGDILDVFCPSNLNPVRFEFFDDIIEDLRIVDRETKKSLSKTEEITVTPVRAFFREDFNAEQLIKDIDASRKKQRLSPDAATRLSSICGEVVAGIEGGAEFRSWALPFVNCSALSDYLPKDAVVIWDEPKRLSDRAKLLTDEHTSRVAYLLGKGEVLPEHATQLMAGGQWPMVSGGQVAFSAITAVSDFFKPDEIVNAKSSSVHGYRSDLKLLANDVKSWTGSDFKVVIFAGQDSEAIERVEKQVHGAKINCDPVKKGFINHSDKLVFIGYDDVFAKPKSVAKLKKNSASVFVAPDIGDFVVHEVHGIGRCEGIVTLDGSFGVKDFILVSYRDGDKLYVPVENANLLSRYSGAETVPKLSRLGGNEFEKIKAKVKKNIKEMAIDLIKLYADREKARGFVYPKDNYLEERFSDAFPHEETLDQLKCIMDVFNDLETDKVMDRLICGDVGYGKTEVALRAAFKVMLSGKQVAFLSPTTILCEQHFNTVKKRFEEFGIKIGCLNRFRSTKEQKQIIEDLKDGVLHFICGTHRLLSKDVRFENLGLLILDEEQRFGVEAKETIKTIKKNVDVLTLSATPIPRTLHMALTGMRDVSVILTPPKERLPVQTSVTESNETLIRDIILREAGRGGQVFLVYNRVETIDPFAARMQRLVPEVKFTVAHGQMQEKVLEESICNFANGLADVLVSSSIIENGIDIPNANTLVVYDADNFGLSQLYQMRGRVGRSDKPAYAYFMYRENKILSETAYKRLSSILEYTELGSGFKIAVRDLEIRGAGNVLGREQHGHMEKVGYDMYCRLLVESVGEIKGTPAVRREAVSLDIAMDASAASYIEDNESRMSFYRRLSEVCSKEEMNALRSEIADVFGAPSEQTINLLDIAEFKLEASEAGLSEVVARTDTIHICFRNAEALRQPGVFAALDKYKGKAQLDISSKLRISFRRSGSIRQMFDTVREFVSQITNYSEQMRISVGGV